MRMTGHKNLLKKIMIVLGIILIVEIIFFVIYKLFIKKNADPNIPISQFNDFISDNDGYVVVGNNNYKDTEDAIYDNDILITQGEIVKLDKNFNTLWTTSYNTGNDITLNSIIKVNDYYIIVGTERKKIDDDHYDFTGIILKVDKVGTVLNAKTYDLLEDTKLEKVIRDGKNNIVIGNSLYRYDRIGNDLGGGIILKIDDNLNILESNNYGGNKSGAFYNIFVLSDSYLVTGSDADYSIVVKFSKSFNRESDDNNLISKKVIYYKTIDNEKSFYPLYYNDNKLYDGKKIYDIKENELIIIDKENSLSNKKVLSIIDKTIYAYDGTTLYLYDLNLNLIKEDKVKDTIFKIKKVNNDIVMIKEIDTNNKRIYKLDMLTRH